MTCEHIESSLDVAAYLLSQRHRLRGLEQTGPYRFSFRFADPDGAAEKDAAAFYAGALIAARDFAANFKRLKDLLYAEKHLQKGNGNGNESHRLIK